ncbi:Ppx/GppA family phosphatase [Bdellovibrio sp. HCB337]|uniref:Ppx/GppA phosphatase family protein n=1 Tax=Bdellovibrio sp. HCB337 TaxID=3394358 RepID=UPI0039A62742
MKVAALDLGSNSFLCLIVEGDKSGIKKVLSDQVKVVRLGQGVDKTGSFHPDALKRAKECLTEFKKEIDRHNVDRILAMATSAARDAKNGSELFKIGEDIGIPIEIIPGSDEARITFAGSTEGNLKGDENVIVIDVGGGSTEFIVGNRSKLHFAKSLDVGCVRMTEKFITAQPLSESEKQAVENSVDIALDSILSEVQKYPATDVLAVAGTPSAIAAAEIGKFDAEKVHGFILDQGKLQKWCDILASTSVQEKIEKYKIESGRADVLFVGATILHRFLLKMNKPAMKVSIKGVRYGVALEVLRR